MKQVTVSGLINWLRSSYETYLIHQPFNMAVLGANKAEKIIDKYAIDSYVIGGHSLGGVMASRFAKKQTSDNLKGVFFLASYPDEKGALNATELPVLSITGSKDGVLNWESYHSSQKLLPAKTDFQVIDGGNHAGFGSYGPQKEIIKPVFLIKNSKTKSVNYF